jgi:GNAT superfamily N-acetyltransferase
MSEIMQVPSTAAFALCRELRLSSDSGASVTAKGEVMTGSGHAEGRKGGVSIRSARRDDVAAIAAMHSADTLGGHGNSDGPEDMPGWFRAFDTIAGSPNDTLYVAESAGEVVGTFQTTLVTSMNSRAKPSMIVEAVQTRGDMRGRGIGEAMIAFAIARAREAGASKVQLTSNLARTDAHRFYRRLGFDQSHVGFRMKL